MGGSLSAWRTTMCAEAALRHRGAPGLCFDDMVLHGGAPGVQAAAGSWSAWGFLHARRLSQGFPGHWGPMLPGHVGCRGKLKVCGTCSTAQSATGREFVAAADEPECSALRAVASASVRHLPLPQTRFVRCVRKTRRGGRVLGLSHKPFRMGVGPSKAYEHSRCPDGDNARSALAVVG